MPAVRVTIDADRLLQAGAPLLWDVASDIARDAHRLCPVDSGDLRSTVRVERLSGTAVAVKAGDSRIDYAEHVERGTSRMAAQPYLRPAALRRRGEYR